MPLLAVVAAVSAGQPRAEAQTRGDFEVPRTAQGTPDFNGIWQTFSEANWGLEPGAAEAGPVMELGAAYAAPPRLGVVQGGRIPYQPWAAEQRDDNYAHRLERDPEIRCYLPGVPRATYMPHPFQIVQGDGHLLMFHQYRGALRTINLEDHSEAPVPSWMGWSNGWFEDDTLVVETAGFNGLAWLDRAGNFASEDMRVVERYRFISPDALLYEATIEDPSVFTEAWTISLPLYRRLEENAEVMEFKCMEFAEELLYGDLARPPEE